MGLPGSGFPSSFVSSRVSGQRDLARRLTSLLMSCGWWRSSRKVEQWIESLSVREFATVAAAAVERLAEDGSRLRFPASRSLGGGLFELRVGLGRVARRVTFYFAEDRRIVLLTTFSQAEAERAGRSPARSGGDAKVHR